jgi:hypothetical protein
LSKGCTTITITVEGGYRHLVSYLLFKPDGSLATIEAYE